MTIFEPPWIKFENCPHAYQEECGCQPCTNCGNYAAVDDAGPSLCSYCREMTATDPDEDPYDKVPMPFPVDASPLGSNTLAQLNAWAKSNLFVADLSGLTLSRREGDTLAMLFYTPGMEGGRLTIATTPSAGRGAEHFEYVPLSQSWRLIIKFGQPLKSEECITVSESMLLPLAQTLLADTGARIYGELHGVTPRLVVAR